MVRIVLVGWLFVGLAAPAQAQTVDAFAGLRGRMVSRIDSRWRGFLIGAAAGAVPGAWLGVGFKTYCSNETAKCPEAPAYVAALFGLIGGWIGAGIDGLIDGQKVVYQR